MNATRRKSPPKASDIKVIAVAAPGADPHTAVVPGKTSSRASTPPSATLNTITATMQDTKTGQSRPISAKISGVIPRAIKQPATP